MGTSKPAYWDGNTLMVYWFSEYLPTGHWDSRGWLAYEGNDEGTTWRMSAKPDAEKAAAFIINWINEG